MTDYVLGLDGGGTKTHAQIVDREGRVRGAGLGGPSNYDDVGVEAAQAGIAQAVQQARAQAGLGEAPFAAAFLGMAGVVSENDRQVIRTIAAHLSLAPADKTGVDYDCRIALAGGLSGRPGIVLIIGTGSSCYGRNAAGEFWMAGGWGHLMGDDGSSYWLGLQALRLTMATFDGRRRSAWLMEQIRQQLGLPDLDDIMHRVYHVGLSRAEIAALAPWLIQAAHQGDADAVAMIRYGAAQLAESVAAVARRLGFADEPSELALVGGLLNAGDIILEPLRAAVAEALPQCRVTLAELPPVTGAGLLALQSLGLIIEGRLAENLRAGSRGA